LILVRGKVSEGSGDDIRVNHVPAEGDVVQLGKCSGIRWLLYVSVIRLLQVGRYV
jgi:hypothetical protein